MGQARSTRIRALGKDHLVLNTLALLVHGRQADEARRFLERLSVGGRRRTEQSLRGYRFAPAASGEAVDLAPVLAALRAADFRYEPLAVRQTTVTRVLQVLPPVFGGLTALGALAAALPHGHAVGPVAALLGAAGLSRLYVPQMATVPLPAWTGWGKVRFFETVLDADRLIVPLTDEDDPEGSLWVIYSRLVAPIQAARAARKAARALAPRPAPGTPVLPGMDAGDADPASEPSEPPAPQVKPVADRRVSEAPKLDLQAVRQRMLDALDNAPPARLPTDLMAIEDRVALMEEHRQRLETRIGREEGVALASKAVVEDFLDVAHESSAEQLTKPGGRTAGAPLVAFGLTRTLGTLMQHQPYLLRNGLKQSTLDGLTNDYVKTLRSTYLHLVQDKRYAMSYHMLAQGFTEWDLQVFRTLERCMKNNDPTASEDLIDLERVLSGYNMDHCIKALPLMLLSIQGYALSLDIKSKSAPHNARFAEMANDVRRILKNLQEQIPEDVYLKSMNLVKAGSAPTLSTSALAS